MIGAESITILLLQIRIVSIFLNMNQILTCLGRRNVRKKARHPIKIIAVHFFLNCAIPIPRINRLWNLLLLFAEG